MRYWQGTDPDAVRSEAERVLSDPKYAVPEPGLIERAIDWVLERFGDLLGRLVSTGAGGGYGIGYVVLVVVALGLAFLLWRFWPSRLRSAKADKASTTIDVRERTGRDRWLERADAAAAEGRWPEAVHARYRATRAGLVEGGELPETEGLTALESLDAFDAAERRRGAYEGEVRRFREIRYGGDEAGAADDEVLRRLDASVLDRSEGGT